MKKDMNKLPGNIYKKLTEQLYDGVYFVNSSRRVLFWNQRATEISGYKKAEIVGRRCNDNLLQHINRCGKKLCSAANCPLVFAMKKNRPAVERVYLRRKDGVRVPVDVHVMPIKYKGKMVGAIEVFRDASIYERMEQQRERAKTLAHVDSLTSLPNRRFMNKKLRFEISKFKKYKDHLHVAIADLDHFKRINDTYGHEKGDLVLRRAASIMDSTLRATDFVARYGGEEFVLILPNTPKENSRIALERVRSNIAKARIIGKAGDVTASIGATRAKSCDTPESIIARADKALYLAKNSGRNNVKYK